MQIMDVVLSKFAMYLLNHIWSILICLRSTHSGCKMHITSLKQNNKIAYFFRHLSQPQMTALFMFFILVLSLPTVWQLHCLHGRGLRKWHRVQPREGGGGRLAPFVRIPGQLWFRYTAVCLPSFLPACLPACLPPRALCLESVMSQQSACLPPWAFCHQSVMSQQQILILRTALWLNCYPFLANVGGINGYVTLVSYMPQIVSVWTVVVGWGSGALVAVALPS